MTNFNPTRAGELAFAIANLRHLYRQMLNGHVRAEHIAEAATGLLGPAIEAIEKLERGVEYLETRSEQLDIIRDQVVAENDALTRDLAKARADLEEARNDVMGYRHQKAALIAERDEARAEVARMRGALKLVRHTLGEWSDLGKAHEYGCGNSRECDACDLDAAIDSALKERDE